MLFWIVDHAALVYLLLGFVALGLLARWWITRNPRYLAGLGALAGLACLVLLLALFIDTDRKQIARTLQSMAEAMKEKPPVRVFDHVSERFRSSLAADKKQLRQAAQRAQQRFALEEVLLWSVEITEISDDAAVVVTFRAKADLRDSVTPVFPCEARFVREADGKWRMIGLKIFKLLSKDEFLAPPD